MTTAQPLANFQPSAPNLTAQPYYMGGVQVAPAQAVSGPYAGQYGGSAQQKQGESPQYGSLADAISGAGNNIAAGMSQPRPGVPAAPSAFPVMVPTMSPPQLTNARLG